MLFVGAEHAYTCTGGIAVIQGTRCLLVRPACMPPLVPLRRVAALAALLVTITVVPISAQSRGDALRFGPTIEKEDYFRPGIAPVRAPAGYDLTIVYFMDYQCPSCRQYTPDVARVLAEDKRVRVIYRDTPIISDLSTVAARAAIAASFQGRHAAFHHALMMSKGRLTEAAIRAAADSAKVDWARLQRDLKARGEDIDLQIARNTELAVATGIMGTPAFIVGDRLSNGALDYESLKAEIGDARAAGATVDKVREVDDKAEIKVPRSLEDAASPITNDNAATRASTPLFRNAEPSSAAASEAGRQSESGGWPYPLLAGAAVLAVIGLAGWCSGEKQHGGTNSSPAPQPWRRAARRW